MDAGNLLDARVGAAFIEALRRAVDMVFFREELTISERIRIGDSVICTIEAQKETGDSSQASGKAYVYQDLIVICVEKVCRALNDPISLHHYEYLRY